MIELKDVTIQQDDFALTNIHFSISNGDYAVLMGPTGSGKTTILEAICGLRNIQSGSIFIDGIDVAKQPPARRGIGYVPQDRALFPAMRIDRQIGYGLSVRGVGSRERSKRVNALAELTGISHLLRRMPAGLSGGELQRVALARALAFYPKVLCLDEPLSALDNEAKAGIIAVLRSVYQAENLTLIHVTHSRTDAEHLATVRFQLRDGRLTKR